MRKYIQTLLMYIAIGIVVAPCGFLYALCLRYGWNHWSIQISLIGIGFFVAKYTWRKLESKFEHKEQVKIQPISKEQVKIQPTGVVCIILNPRLDLYSNNYLHEAHRPSSSIQLFSFCINKEKLDINERMNEAYFGWNEPAKGDFAISYNEELAENANA